MSALRNETPVTSWILSGLQQPLSELATAVKRIYLARQARAATQHLLTHDDRILSDIGVSRNDVEQALSVDWDKDPTEALAEMRRRRMQAGRQGLVGRAVSR